MASDEEACKMVDEIRASLGPEAIIKQTGCAVTIIVDDIICQVVLRLYNSPDEVMSGFDIAPCKVGIWVDRETGQPRVGATPSWFEGVRRWAFAIDLTCWSGATVVRTLKYVAKGFDAMLPGLRRDDVRLLPKYTFDRDLRGLLTAEAFMKLRRTGGERIAHTDVQAFIGRSQMLASSDYAPILKVTNRFLHAVKSMVVSGLTCFEDERPSHTGDAFTPLQWARFDAASAITFFPMDPCIMKAYDKTTHEITIKYWLKRD